MNTYEVSRLTARADAYKTLRCKPGFEQRGAVCQPEGRGKKLGSIVLQQHQERIADKLEHQKGLIVYHGLGSGKTLAGINAAENYGGAVVVTPASLRDNFRKELVKAKAKGKYDIYSYETFSKNPPDLKDRMLLIDEGHRLRNSNTQRSQSALESGKDAKKILLLTGTPIQNKPHEIAPLVNLVSGENIFPLSEKAFNDKYIQTNIKRPGFFGKLFNVPTTKELKPKNLNDFRNKASKYVDHYSPKKDGYPTVETHSVDVPMSQDQQKTYLLLQKQMTPALRYRLKNSLPPSKSESNDLNVFINASRQISNSAHGFNRNSTEVSPKIQKVVDKVSESKQPALIYSNYIDSGVDRISQELKKKDVSHDVFTGKLNDKEKKRIVDGYNSGKTQVLIVSSAGGEGLDLKGTRQVHVMEPHWNDPKIEQVIGRAARFKSHDHLPESDRNVQVFKYISTFPKNNIWDKDMPTADQYLDALSKKKNLLNQAFLETLK